MKSPSSEHSSNAILRILLDSALPEPCAWSTDDLRAVLAHMLATPLRLEVLPIATALGVPADQVASIINQCGCDTFGTALNGATPNAEALRLVKAFAKSFLQPGQQDLPKDVARVLYVASILRARKCGARDVSSLPNADVTREARRVLTYDWLPDDLRALIRQCISLEDGGSMSDPQQES